MNLHDLEEGKRGIITRVRGRGAFRRRVMEMGFVYGEEVCALRKAPFSGPMEFEVKGTKVLLRKSEAALIEITTAGDAARQQGRVYAQWLEQESVAHTGEGTHITVALVGNTTSGKTTLFNLMTTSKEKVGNYSGVTQVPIRKDVIFGDHRITWIDLPGVYSLTGDTNAGRTVRDCLLHDMPDVIVNVADVNNLERNLYLTTDLIDTDSRVIMVLSKTESFEKSGSQLDTEMLTRLMGIPVTDPGGESKQAIARLNERIVMAFLDRDKDIRHIHINYGEQLEQSVRVVKSLIRTEANIPLTNIISGRFLAIKLLQGDKHAQDLIRKCPNRNDIAEAVERESRRIFSLYRVSASDMITDYKSGFVKGALKETLRKGRRKTDRSERIDRIITHRYLGLPVFAAFMWLMFTATFTLGSYPMAWIERFVAWISGLLNTNMADGMLRDLLVDGVISGAGGVLVFLPNILILYFFISLMEDTGYMSRAVFIVDRMMHRIGLHGKSFIPLVMGFGCNVPAILATRMLENRKERMITILINPFISCNARLPVYILFITAFFPETPGTILFVVYFTGILVAVLTALILKRFLRRDADQPFVMELPGYRAPSGRVIATQMWDRSLQYLKKIGGVILIASVIFWALSYFPLNIEYTRDYDREAADTSGRYQSLIAGAGMDTTLVGQLTQTRDQKLMHLKTAKKSEQKEKSYLGRIGHFMEPVIRPLGFDWRVGIAILSGIPAKEIIVSSLAVLYQVDSDADVDNQTLMSRIRDQKHMSGTLQGEPLFNKAVALAFMVFVLLYIPCIGTLTAIIRETGKRKWGLISVVYSLSLAWVLAFVVYRIGLWVF